MEKTYVEVGDTFLVTLPYSEVCMHMRVAGERMAVTLKSDWSVQLLNTNGSEFSFPITRTEAGVFTEADGYFVSGKTPVVSKSGELVVRDIYRPTHADRIVDAIKNPMVPDVDADGIPWDREVD